jgi:hypothetical protein
VPAAVIHDSDSGELTAMGMPGGSGNVEMERKKKTVVFCCSGCYIWHWRGHAAFAAPYLFIRLQCFFFIVIFFHS